MVRKPGGTRRRLVMIGSVGGSIADLVRGMWRSESRQPLAGTVSRVSLPVWRDLDPGDDGRGARSVHLRNFLSRGRHPRVARLPGLRRDARCGLVVLRLRHALRGPRRDSRAETSERRAHRGGAAFLRVRAIPRLSAARQLARASGAGRAKPVAALDRSGDPWRCANCRGRLRNRPDVPVPGARRSRGRRRRPGTRVTRARHRGGTAVWARTRAIRRNRSPASGPQGGCVRHECELFLTGSRRSSLFGLPRNRRIPRAFSDQRQAPKRPDAHTCVSDTLERADAKL